MPRLYLLRHGQTEFNIQHRVQGHCDSPLTAQGIEQAHGAAAWLTDQVSGFDRVCSSPLGRAMETARTVCEDLRAAGRSVPDCVEPVDGLMERSYGPFEGGPADEVPAELWDPGETLVPYGGEGSVALRERIVSTLTDMMFETVERKEDATVLAVSHGSATLQFKLAWAHLARCEQDVHLGNCCILVYEFDPQERTFTNLQIVNQ